MQLKDEKDSKIHKNDRKGGKILYDYCQRFQKSYVKLTYKVY